MPQPTPQTNTSTHTSMHCAPPKQFRQPRQSNPVNREPTHETFNRVTNPLDDADFLTALVRAMYEELPEPKPKTKRGKGKK